jgi:nicotinamide-nucleotide amidase
MAEALSALIPTSTEELTHRVLQAACDQGLMLSTAESCTGGLIASLLTDVPGCSHAFGRGFVTYTDAAKVEMLGLPADLVADAGAVSEPVARAMAEGAIARSEADYAISVTGWAESGDGPGQIAGLVWFGLSARAGTTTAQKQMFGDVGRAQFRIRCLDVALEVLAKALGVARLA